MWGFKGTESFFFFFSPNSGTFGGEGCLTMHLEPCYSTVLVHLMCRLPWNLHLNSTVLVHRPQRLLGAEWACSAPLTNLYSR